MARQLTAGLISDHGRLEALVSPLAQRGLTLATRSVAADGPAPDGVEVLLIDIATLDISPQHLSQRIRVWGMPPFVAVAPRFDLGRARIWHALGAIDLVAQDDYDRLALLLEQLDCRRGAASSDLLQTVIDAVPAPIFFKDERGVYLGCNRAFEAFIGVSSREIVGKTVHDIAPPHLAEVYLKADRDLLDAGGQQVYESQVRFKDGSDRDIVFHKAVFFKRDGSLGGLVGAMLEITERKRLEATLEKLATLDPLTGINNRRSFMTLATRDLSRCRRDKQPMSMLVVDVDHFKQVNDEYGHAAGDAVLVHLARVMEGMLRQHDIVARAGGEEFYVSLSNADLASAEQSAQRLCSRLAAEALEHEGRSIRVTASIGVSPCDLSQDVEAALRRADDAMYEAKRQGRNRVVVARPEAL